MKKSTNTTIEEFRLARLTDVKHADRSEMARTMQALSSSIARVVGVASEWRGFLRVPPHFRIGGDPKYWSRLWTGFVNRGRLGRALA